MIIPAGGIQLRVARGQALRVQDAGRGRDHARGIEDHAGFADGAVGDFGVDANEAAAGRGGLAVGEDRGEREVRRGGVHEERGVLGIAVADGQLFRRCRDHGGQGVFRAVDAFTGLAVKHLGDHAVEGGRAVQVDFAVFKDHISRVRGGFGQEDKVRAFSGGEGRDFHKAIGTEHRAFLQGPGQVVLHDAVEAVLFHPDFGVHFSFGFLRAGR